MGEGSRMRGESLRAQGRTYLDFLDAFGQLALAPCVVGGEGVVGEVVGFDVFEFAGHGVVFVLVAVHGVVRGLFVVFVLTVAVGGGRRFGVAEGGES